MEFVARHSRHSLSDVGIISLCTHLATTGWIIPAHCNGGDVTALLLEAGVGDSCWKQALEPGTATRKMAGYSPTGSYVTASSVLASS